MAQYKLRVGDLINISSDPLRPNYNIVVDLDLENNLASGINVLVDEEDDEIMIKTHRPGTIMNIKKLNIYVDYQRMRF